MIQTAVGILLGAALALIFGPEERALGHYVIWGFLGVLIVNAVSGGRNSLLLRLFIVYLIGYWAFCYMVLSSHVVFDPWNKITFDDYLEMPWGPAGLTKDKTLEEAKKDEKSIRQHRARFIQYQSELSQRQKTLQDAIHSREFSTFRLTAAYANRGTTLVAQGISDRLQEKLPIYAAWVNRPPTRYERYANPIYSFPQLRGRFVGYLCLLFLLSAIWCLLRVFHTAPEHSSETVIEICMSSRVWGILTLNLIALTVAAMIPLSLIFFGPTVNVLKYLYPVLVGCIVWFSFFKGREIC